MPRLTFGTRRPVLIGKFSQPRYRQRRKAHNVMAQYLYAESGAPTDGTSGTLAGVAQVSALLVTDEPALYQNYGTQASPTWQPVDYASLNALNALNALLLPVQSLDYLAIAGTAGATITMDWGDGSTPEVFTLTGAAESRNDYSTAAEPSHTYTDGRSGHLVSIAASDWDALDLFDCEVTAIAPLPDIGSRLSRARNVYFSGFSALMGRFYGCRSIEELYLGSNQLTTLDLSGLNALQALYLHNNQLTTIDLSGLTALQTLNLGFNQFYTIDLSGLTALQTLSLNDNHFSDNTIDLSGLNALQALNLGSNQFSTIDLSGLTALQTLYLHNNQLTTLDLSGLTALSYVYLHNNALTEAAVDAVLTTLASGTISNGQVRLDMGTNAPPSATGLTAKATLEGRGWTVTVNS